MQNPSKANPSKAELAEESGPTKMSDSDLSALVDLTFVGLTSRMSGVAEHKSLVCVPPEQKQNVKILLDE